MVPLLNRNQGQVAAAQAEHSGAQARREAVELAARAEVAAAQARDTHAQRAVALYAGSARGLARQNLDVVAKTFELGRSDDFRHARRAATIPGGRTRVHQRAPRGMGGTRRAEARARRGAMTDNSRVTLRWASAAVIAVAAGGDRCGDCVSADPRLPAAAPKATSDEPAIATSHSAGHGTPAPPGGTAAAPGETLPDVMVMLTKEAVERAGIKVMAVDTADAATAMRLPGVVEPNAYKQVVVTPIAAGRVTGVLVELGQRVGRGQTMARIFSPDLAEAQTRFISARAELAAHEQELRRTEKLVEIGAASRQELERTHALHTAQTAEVQSVRARLELLGVPPAALDGPAPGKLAATINVPAPNSGVVTERLANVGLNVDLATKLFTVVDLSTVWVVADLYEKDFSRVRVGSPVTVTTAAYPGLAITRTDQLHRPPGESRHAHREGARRSAERSP